MRIGLIVPAPDPPIFGGAQRLWRGLADAIKRYQGHDVDLVEIPCPERDLVEVVGSYRRFAELDVSHFDMVITTKYPAWMVEHPRHIVYMQHKLRGLYDAYPKSLPNVWDYGLAGLDEFWNFLRWNSTRDSLPRFFEMFEDARSRWGTHPVFAFPGPLARKIVHYLDDVALQGGSIERFFAISNTVAQRSDYFPKGSEVTVLPHPSDLEPLPPRRQDHFLSVGRLDGPKRIDLLVRAMDRVPSGIPLKIVGTGPESDSLKALTAGNPVIQFIDTVEDDELASLYADALAVAFVPLQEDLGLITFEAFASGSPVVTCFDSGGPSEWVRQGIDGLVALADPVSIGRALVWLAANPEKAAAMGRAGQVRGSRVTWKNTVSALFGDHSRSRTPTDQPRAGLSGTKRSKRVCVLSTYPIRDPRSGGAIRSKHVYGSLTSDFEVQVVSLAATRGSVSTVEIAPGFFETTIPKSKEHVARELEASHRANVPLEDILASRLAWLTPEFESAVQEACRSASLIVLSHPYLYEIARKVAPDLPMVYDAHNFEFALKQESLPTDPIGAELLEMVRSDESGAVSSSALVAVTSIADRDSMIRSYSADPQKFISVPNGVDTYAVSFSDASTRERRREVFLKRLPFSSGRQQRVALFVGSWHGPNLDAASRLVAMAPQVSDVMLLLVGDHSAAFTPTTLPENVRLMGQVTDLVKTSLLGLADAGLNPMSQGAGTNLKMLEYFAAGVPVASTSFGSRGFEAELEGVVETADLTDFPRAIQTVVDGGFPADRLSSARSLVEKHYDWKVIGEKFKRAVVDVVG